MSITQLNVCICSLRYPACNAHVPYCQLWPDWLYNIFSTSSHKRHDFQKKGYSTQNVCFDFLYNFFSETFLVLRRNERDMIIYILVFIQNTLCSCPILMKIACSRQIFEKSSNTVFHENPSSGAELFHVDGRTVGQK